MSEQIATEQEVEDLQAPLVEHLRELRKRLMCSVLTLLVSFAVCMVFCREYLSIPGRAAG